MPHLTVHLPENRLTGNEPMLVAALTDAIVDVCDSSPA
jgi:phenylpyruvate tautomerase PptA (4-oxalocrotonate tautomerase family)